MAIPKTKEITVTTAKDVLDSNRGNYSYTASELGVFRTTLKAMINDRRPNVVLIGENGEYTLLK